MFFWLAKAIYGRKIAKTELTKQPVIILGYWRSGTTWLNELLVCDPRTCYPTTFQCFAPATFMVGQVFGKIVEAIMPSKRPMDSVELNMENPQEDEFAVLNLGLESPYRFMAFPSLRDDEKFTSEYYPADKHKSDRWTSLWVYFLKCVQYLNPGKRLILKSPLHTARINLILSVLPDAKFIHISRDPRSILGSSQKAFGGMIATQSLEFLEEGKDDPTSETLESLERVYDVFFEQRKSLGSSQIAYVRYEDLRSDPFGEIQKIYETLDLGNIDAVAEPLKCFIADKKGYSPDSYEIPEATLRRASVKWAHYMQHFGYSF